MSKPTKMLIHCAADLKQYRAPFYRRLREVLSDQGVDLVAAYGLPSDTHASRGDRATLEPGSYRPLKNVWLGGGRAAWQAGLAKAVEDVDYVVFSQDLKLSGFWASCAWSVIGSRRVAFWGHGRNRKGPEDSLVERVKRNTARIPEWWFTYTPGTGEYLETLGVPSNRISVVENSIDTESLRSDVASLRGEASLKLRRDMGVRPDDYVGVFVGALYREKCVSFLIDAARLVRLATKGRFHLVVVGNGPDREIVERAAAEDAWIHYRGSCFGSELAGIYASCDVFLMPGLTGLAILDAFAAGIPFFTTDLPYHSPEIEYLEDGKTGQTTPHDVGAYAASVIAVLEDEAVRKSMSDAAEIAGQRYSMENMVSRFAKGVQQWTESEHLAGLRFERCK